METAAATHGEFSSCIDYPMKLHMYKMYNALATDPSHDLEFDLQSFLETTLQQWQSLPSLVSASHIPILFTAQQIIELRETTVTLSSSPLKTMGDVDQRILNSNLKYTKTNSYT